jgi:hypothetical protein
MKKSYEKPGFRVTVTGFTFMWTLFYDFKKDKMIGRGRLPDVNVEDL